MKVLMINDYPLDKYYENWKIGLTPSQQLWGKVEIDKLGEHEMIILAHEKYKFLNRLGRFFGIEHLDQQIRILLYKDNFDVVYAPFAAATTKLLLILKLFGIYKKPIIAIIHYPLLGSGSKSIIKRRIGKKLISGYDKMVYISKGIYEDNLSSFSLTKQEVFGRFEYLNWGAETEFYETVVEKNTTDEHIKQYAVSAGQTDRDFDLLIEAFRNIDLKLKIYSKPDFKPKTSNIPDNVEIYTSGVTYKELLEIYRHSCAILISFKMTQKSTIGITSLLDALATSKPVIITENKFIDIDVNKEGIGFTVKEGDVNGWTEKINYLLDNPEEGIEMGIRGKKLQLDKYNMNNFGTGLFKIISSIK